jgi:Protein of unknown function (DUF3106)
MTAPVHLSNSSALVDHTSLSASSIAVCGAKSGRVLLVTAWLTTFLLMTAGTVLAQSASGQPDPLAAKVSSAMPKASVPKAPVSRPVWAQLTVQQQIALRPLSASWDTINEAQKRKWLELSKTFSSLSEGEQARLHERMVEWVVMSPQQRAQARLNFAQTRELSTDLSAEEKKAKWQTYQALTAAEKQKLAEKATPKPTGAATAVTPVAPQKLTTVSSPLAPRANRVEPQVTPLQPTTSK